MMKSKSLTHLFGLMALLLLTSVHSFAQNLHVQGRVLDELGGGLDRSRRGHSRHH